MKEIIKKIDTDADGKIDYNEFIAACLTKQTYLKEEHLLNVFRILDDDDSGKISKQNLKNALMKDKIFKYIDEKYWDEMLLKSDTNLEGSVKF